MALHPHAAATGTRITSSRRWASFPIAVTGVLNKVRYQTDGPVSVGARMNIKINDVSIYATTPDMPLFDNGLFYVEQTLNVNVNKGDIVLLEVLVSLSLVVVGPKLYGTLYVEDNLPTYFGGSSATSFSIGTGSKAFTTQKGLAYTAGSRVRIASSASPTTNYMEGIVTAYSGTTLTVTVDLAVGSGTHTDWLLSLAGERGATGSTGSTGSAGSPGVVQSIVPGTNITVDNTDPANPIVASTGGGGGGGLDYTVFKEQDFTTGTLNTDFQFAGTGGSISGGKGVLLPTANDGFGASYPRFELITPVSLVNRCVIAEIAEKPELTAAGAYSLNVKADALTHQIYWDLNSVSLNAVDTTGHNILANIPGGGGSGSMHGLQKHFLRIRYDSKGSGANTHLIFYEWSFNGMTWFPLWVAKVTSTDIDSMSPLLAAASYSGTTPLASKFNRFIIGDMI